MKKKQLQKIMKTACCVLVLKLHKCSGKIPQREKLALPFREHTKHVIAADPL